MHPLAAPIEPYNASTDLAPAFLLWQLVVGQAWPIDFTRLRQVLDAPGAQHFVVKDHGHLIGLVVTTRTPSQDGQTGALQALLVAPSHQRQGLGSALHEAALHHLRAIGMQRVQLGGLVPRFWCGLPAQLLPARAFFSAHGWAFDQPVYDLVQDLRHASPPPAIYRRVDNEGITLQTGRADDVDRILDFEQRTFPDWLHHYERCARLGDVQDMLAARQHDGQIVGTLLMYSPQSHASRTDLVWRVLLGYDAGALGAVGVAPFAQRRGIGLALVARASDLLKARGVRNCLIDWVQLTDFYAQVGYSRWRAFFPSMRELS